MNEGRSFRVVLLSHFFLVGSSHPGSFSPRLKPEPKRRDYKENQRPSEIQIHMGVSGMITGRLSVLFVSNPITDRPLWIHWQWPL